MGQAKQRGTFEERLAKAVARNQSLRAAALKSSMLTKQIKEHGIHRVATRLVMSGLLMVDPLPPKP